MQSCERSADSILSPKNMKPETCETHDTFEELPVEIWRMIFDRCDMEAKFIFRTTCHMGAAFFKTSHACRIVEKLHEKGLDAFTLCDLLVKSGGAIMGSFPLQCVLGEHWDDSDIDIYIPYENYKGGGRCPESLYEWFFYGHCANPGHLLFYSIEKDLSGWEDQFDIVSTIGRRWRRNNPNRVNKRLELEGIYSSMPSGYTIDGVACCDKFSFQYRKTEKWITIDIIALENHCGVARFHERFDFTFCQVMFDGKTVKIHDPRTLNKKGSLTPASLETYRNYVEMKYKNMTPALGQKAKTGAKLRMKYRIAKYESRGFEITNKCQV